MNDERDPSADQHGQASPLHANIPADDWGNAAPIDESADPEAAFKRQRLQDQLAAQPYTPKSGNVAYCPACAAACDPEMTSCPECGHTIEATRNSSKQTLTMVFIGGLILMVLLGAAIIIFDRGDARQDRSPAYAPRQMRFPGAEGGYEATPPPNFDRGRGFPSRR